MEKLEATGVTPFHYKHLGSFAYVGDNKAVLQMPIIGKARQAAAANVVSRLCLLLLLLFLLLLQALLVGVGSLVLSISAIKENNVSGPGLQ